VEPEGVRGISSGQYDLLLLQRPSAPRRTCPGSRRYLFEAHGPKLWYRHDYSGGELSTWAKGINTSDAKRAWVYFNNEYEAHAPQNAAVDCCEKAKGSKGRLTESCASLRGSRKGSDLKKSSYARDDPERDLPQFFHWELPSSNLDATSEIVFLARSTIAVSGAPITAGHQSGYSSDPCTQRKP